MACTAIWKVEDSLPRVLEYVMNKDKTEEQCFVSGLNVIPSHALETMKATKRYHRKLDGILAFHGYQSFAIGETTPEQAHAIGVQLAQELYGERFEVVISTHLDKGHIHNHFVVNAVSFKDGKRFYDNKETYAKMRMVSDRLCYEHGLSVIENPERGVSMHYAEWKANKENQPTWRDLIRTDIDKAISASFTFSRFLKMLKEQGYEVDTSGKHLKVRPAGKERYVRLYSLGKNYTPEAITKRILGQPVQARPPAPKPKPRIQQYRLRGSYTGKGLKGYRALYFRYLHKMGILPKRRASKKRTHFLLREDIRKLDEISQQVMLLCKNGIDTSGQLTEYMASLENQMKPLYTERKTLYAAVRRSATEDEKALYKSEIRVRTEKLSHLRKELKTAGAILTRSVEIAEKLERVKQDEIENRKEQKEHEPIGRRR